MEPNLIQALTDGDLTYLSKHPLTLNGKNVLFVGLTVTLYFATPFVPNINTELCRCIDEYLALAPEPPTLGGLPGFRQWIDFSKKRMVKPAEVVAKLNEDREWDAVYTWTKTDEEAAPWYLETVRTASIVNWALSFLHVSFPLEWIGDSRLPSLLKTWSERLDAYHGYAGLSLLIPPDQPAATQLDGIVYVAAKAFPGLNIDMPASHAGLLQSGIKTIDWFTVLGKTFVEKLGGATTLDSLLAGQFGVTPLSTGGRLIQTSKMPQLADTGDRNMEPYYALNSILKPVRIVDYPYSFQSGQAFQTGQTTEPYMDRDAARAWIARYDR